MILSKTEEEIAKTSRAMELYFLIRDKEATKEQYNEYMTKHASQAEIEMGKPVALMSWEEFEVYKVLDENLQKGKEKGEYCKLCRNKGYTVKRDSKGYIYNIECSCMAQRRTNEKLQQSEYAKMLTSKTFENFNIKFDWQTKMLHACKKWLAQDKYPFLYLGGKSGAGKSHLAVATFVAYLRRGVDSRFVSWRTESRDLKMRMGDYDFYEPKLKELKEVPLLLLDDFLWGNDNQTPTAEDWRLAKEIIDARGENGRRTIFTSNFNLGLIVSYSEVVGSRLFEYTGGENNFDVELGFEAENYRLNGMKYELLKDNSTTPFD